MLLRFGHVFGIAILAPGTKAGFFVRTHQKYGNVDDTKYQKIINYASKERD